MKCFMRRSLAIAFIAGLATTGWVMAQDPPPQQEDVPVEKEKSEAGYPSTVPASSPAKAEQAADDESKQESLGHLEFVQDKTGYVLRPRSTGDERQVMVFTLKSTPPEVVQELLGQAGLSRDVAITIRGNRIIVYAPPKSIHHIGTLIKELESRLGKEEEMIGIAPQRPVQALPAYVAQPNWQDMPGVRVHVPALEPNAVALVFARNQQHEKAEAYRKLVEEGKTDKLDEARKELQKAVEAAFDSQQKVQQAELKNLRERLKQVEHNLEVRSKARDRIIENRVQELIEPALKWAQSAPPAPAAPVAAAAPLAPQALESAKQEAKRVQREAEQTKDIVERLKKEGERLRRESERAQDEAARVQDEAVRANTERARSKMDQTIRNMDETIRNVDDLTSKIPGLRLEQLDQTVDKLGEMTSEFPPQGKVVIWKYLEDMRRLVREKRYEEALQRIIWFRENALKHDSATGQLSSVIDDWKSLGEVYPPAKAQMIAYRDAATSQVAHNGETTEVFYDVATFNRALGEKEKTVELFEAVERIDPKLAQKYWHAAKDAVIEAKRYDLIRKYIDLTQEFDTVMGEYDFFQSMVELNKSLFAHPNLRGEPAKATDRFVRNTLQLIDVAIALNQPDAAKDIQKKALEIVDHPRLREALPQTKDE